MTPDWGFHCAEVVIDHIRETTGRDIWAELGGCPRSWREGKALYERMGVRSLAQAVGKVLGDPVHPLKAKPGDIAMIDGALGVCLNVCAAQFMDHIQPMRKATAVWRLRGRP